MRIVFFLVVLATTLCSACSPVLVSPIATPTGKINPTDQSITETRGGVAFTVKLDALSVSTQPTIDSIAAFHVTVANQTGETISFSPQAFVLRDGDGRQYRSVTPEAVREIVSRDTVYLIPYPYVGYYYLEDQLRMSQADSMSSELPYYAQYHPQDLFTRALPEGPIIGQSKVSGVVYFIVELEETTRVDLLLFADDSLAGEPLVIFPFIVEK